MGTTNSVDIKVTVVGTVEVVVVGGIVGVGHGFRVCIGTREALTKPAKHVLATTTEQAMAVGVAAIVAIAAVAAIAAITAVVVGLVDPHRRVAFSGLPFST